jgi:hypothetical protein
MPGVSNQECKRLGLSCAWEEGGWRFLSEWVLLREGQPGMSLRVFPNLKSNYRNLLSQMKTRGVSHCDLAIYIKNI